MNFRILFGLVCLARFAPAQTACLSVDGSAVLARDLGSMLPGFQALAPETVLAAGPLPGVRRVFRPAELASLGRRHGVAVDAATGVCVERRMVTLEPEKLLGAMRAALDIPDARFEIVETSRYPVPEGRIEFRRESLRRPALLTARTPVEWRGNIIYDRNRRFSIWARVIITATVDRVVAAQGLPGGEPVAASQVRMESTEMFPVDDDVAQSPDQVVGRIPWRTIPAGRELHLSQTAAPLEVRRGDSVEVEVESGATRLSITGRAESAGRLGDVIPIRNLSSNKIFQARIAARGKARIDTDPVSGN